jgi:serine/threonine protein kinase
VDFWALGVLLCELSTGDQPFHNSSEMAVFSKILSLGTPAMPTLPIPSSAGLSTEMCDLINKLVVKEPEKRLGMNPELKGIDGLKEHPIFNGFDWKQFTGGPSPLLALAVTSAEEATSAGVTEDMKKAWELPFEDIEWLPKDFLSGERQALHH